MNNVPALESHDPWPEIVAAARAERQRFGAPCNEPGQIVAPFLRTESMVLKCVASLPNQGGVHSEFLCPRTVELALIPDDAHLALVLAAALLEEWRPHGGAHLREEAEHQHAEFVDLYAAAYDPYPATYSPVERSLAASEKAFSLCRLDGQWARLIEAVGATNNRAHIVLSFIQLERNTARYREAMNITFRRLQHPRVSFLYSEVANG